MYIHSSKNVPSPNIPKSLARKNMRCMTQHITLRDEERKIEHNYATLTKCLATSNVQMSCVETNRMMTVPHLQIWQTCSRTQLELIIQPLQRTPILFNLGSCWDNIANQSQIIPVFEYMIDSVHIPPKQRTVLQFKTPFKNMTQFITS